MLTTQKTHHDYNNHRLLQNLHLIVKAPVASSYTQATSGHSRQAQTSLTVNSCPDRLHVSTKTAWRSHLASKAQQLIVDGDSRHPLALSSSWCSGDGEQGNEVGGALVRVEGQACDVNLTPVNLGVPLLLCCSAPSQLSACQHSTAQHSTAQHSTAQHSTAQHSTFAQHICTQEMLDEH